MSQVFNVNAKQASYIANTKINMDFLSKEYDVPSLINAYLESKRILEPKWKSAPKKHLSTKNNFNFQLTSY